MDAVARTVETSDRSARRDRAVTAESARAYLLTVLGEFVLPVGGRVWTAALIEALGALGVEERAARQAIARSAERGLLEAERVGRRTRWELTDAARNLLGEGSRRIYSFHREARRWDGRWLLLFASVPEVQRDLRHRLRVRLGWAGFASMAPGAWVSPWVEREPEARDVLGELGLLDTARSFIGALGDIGGQAELVAQAWDLDDIEAAYEVFIKRFTTVAVHGGLPAFVELTQLVHQWRRFPFLDPDLPAELLPVGWSGHRAATLFRRLHDEWRSPAWAWWSERMAAAE
jgi:phenylacetic acid degradation operon negative regulatory protein